MRQDSVTPFVLTYFAVRQSLGVIALLFPLVLLAGGLLTEHQILPSISDYYFSAMRDCVVGALVAIGIFLLAYQSDFNANAERLGRFTAIGAGSASIGLALFPNKPHATGIETFVHAVMDDRISVMLHFMCSFVFLTTLTLFCLKIFSRAATQREKNLYKISGYVLLGSGITATLASFLRAFDWFGLGSFVENTNLIFWLETLGIWAFCVAWLIKGQSERQHVVPIHRHDTSLLVS